MAKKIDAKEVELYLLENTDFFLTRESLVSEISFKHDSDGATSLLEMQIRKLRDEQSRLNDMLSGFLSTGKENEELFFKSKDLTLALITAKDFAAVKKLVEELDLTSQVMFFKDISSDLKNALTAKSNIFVMPSILHKTSVEGFGIAYVEAAQYGVPSLGGKDGGASDAIDHDKTGLICDGNNLDDIYSSLNSMIENKKYIELGKNAQEHVSKFQWDKILEEYKKILN